MTAKRSCKAAWASSRAACRGSRTRPATTACSLARSIWPGLQFRADHHHHSRNRHAFGSTPTWTPRSAECDGCATSYKYRCYGLTTLNSAGTNLPLTKSCPVAFAPEASQQRSSTPFTTRIANLLRQRGQPGQPRYARGRPDLKRGAKTHKDTTTFLLRRLTG
jgi:hypothetical protein